MTARTAGYSVKKTARIVLFLLVAVMCLSLRSSPAAAQEPKFLGKWIATGVIPDGPTVTVNLEFSLNNENSYKLLFFVPEMMKDVIPADSLAVKEKTVFFAIFAANGTYEGKLTDAGVIEGVWKQNGIALPLAFTRKPTEEKK